MSHNENPFAYSADNTGGGRGFQDYENPFAFQTEPPLPAKDTTYVTTYSSHPLRLQRWNTGLRLVTASLCLGAVLLTFFSKDTPSSGYYQNLTLKYDYDGTMVFFLYTNLVVCIYAVVLGILALVMGRNGTGETTPPRLVFPFIVVNVLALLFIALAFAASVSLEQLNHTGFTIGSTSGLYITWPRLCDDYGQFCNMIDTALGFSATAFCTFLASTCIDAYCLHTVYR